MKLASAEHLGAYSLFFASLRVQLDLMVNSTHSSSTICFQVYTLWRWYNISYKLWREYNIYSPGILAKDTDEAEYSFRLIPLDSIFVVDFLLFPITAKFDNDLDKLLPILALLEFGFECCVLQLGFSVGNLLRLGNESARLCNEWQLSKWIFTTYII